MFGVHESSITKKLTRMNVLVSGAALVIACMAFVGYDLFTFRGAMVHSLSIQAQMAGSNSVSALLFNDPAAAENTLSALKAAPNIISASIYTLDRRPFAAYWRDGSGRTLTLPEIPASEIEAHWFKDGKLELVRTIIFQGAPTGTVYVRSDLREMTLRLKRYAGIAFMVLLASLTGAFLAASIIQQVVAEPIVRLAEIARTVSREKNYALRATPTGELDEPDILIGAFNEMLEKIQEREGALRQAHDELERRVEERTAQLAAANKDLEAFSYSVSHDLRAPLRHIDGFSKLLVEEHGAQLNPEASEYLTLIRDSTREMGQLVDDLLNLARVGRKELAVHVTSLNTLVDEVVVGLKRANPDRVIEWKIEKLPYVECDPGLTKQVFANLLSNAVKFTRPRDPTVIEVGAVKEGGEPVIFVRDNGVGFSMKTSSKLFGVFQRLHRPEDFEGTGVGLATVQRIVQKHGGRVWAEAQLDRGAAFFFTLAAPVVTESRSAQTHGAEI